MTRLTNDPPPNVTLRRSDPSGFIVWISVNEPPPTRSCLSVYATRPGSPGYVAPAGRAATNITQPAAMARVHKRTSHRLGFAMTTPEARYFLQHIGLDLVQLGNKDPNAAPTVAQRTAQIRHHFRLTIWPSRGVETPEKYAARRLQPEAR